MKKIIYFLPVILVVLVAGCTSTGNNTTNTAGNPAQTYHVNITTEGFVPQTITVNSGDTVIWTNQADQAAWPASDPHPTHTNYPGFDAKKALSNGDTYQFSFISKGTWGYHSHLNPGMKGTVIVK